jgi:SAM-dependent methyltransferase
MKPTQTTCRVCAGALDVLLQYDEMPKAAQHLPLKSELDTERGVDLEVCQCMSCGLVQLSNEPVPYYKEVIRAAAYSEEMKEFRINQFKELVEKYSLQNKKVIEVGCGKGEYLSLMSIAGMDAYGIEYAPESVKECRKENLQVFEGYLETGDDKISEESFDGFFILNFFEHLPDPNGALAGIAANLTDDGIGLIEVPNFDMILKNNLFSEFINDHLFYFTKETLISTLSQNGFEVLEANEVWHDYIISIVVRKRQKAKVEEFYKQQQKLKQELHAYINRFEDQKVAIWGAGHQALAIISLTKLHKSDKIKYVIDDAPFKQGKYTPASHLPIVAANKIYSDPVNAIIVMGASYSCEIAAKIRRTFDKSINVAILRDYGLEYITPEEKNGKT